MVGYFTTEELSLLVWDVSQKFSEKKTYLDIVSQKQISCDLSTSFAGAKWRRPLGGSSWKLLELTSVSRFLAYVKAMCWSMRVTRATAELCLQWAVRSAKWCMQLLYLALNRLQTSWAMMAFVKSKQHAITFHHEDWANWCSKLHESHERPLCWLIKTKSTIQKSWLQWISLTTAGKMSSYALKLIWQSTCCDLPMERIDCSHMMCQLPQQKNNLLDWTKKHALIILVVLELRNLA